MNNLIEAAKNVIAHWNNGNIPARALHSLRQAAAQAEADHIADAVKMVCLTAEQAQQIEATINLWSDAWKYEEGKKALATIRSARAKADHIRDATKMVAATHVRQIDLTDDEINDLWDSAVAFADPTGANLRFKFAHAIIAKCKEKNKC